MYQYSVLSGFRKPDEGPDTKRIKIEEEEEDDDDEDNEEGEDVKKKNESAVDITEKFILERLNPGLAADLVRNLNRCTVLFSY